MRELKQYEYLENILDWFLFMIRIPDESLLNEQDENVISWCKKKCSLNSLLKQIITHENFL